MVDPIDVTDLLQDIGRGDRAAADRLLPLIYDELRLLAHHHLQHERPDHTLQATAIVHEVYMKMVDHKRVQWKNRAQFFAVAAQAIRRILIDHARGLRRLRRGGQRPKLSLDDVATLAMGSEHSALLELDEAMCKLTQEHPEKARVVEMRFFGGLTAEEAAQICGVSARTVERYWQFARAWLYREMTADHS